MYTDPTRHYTSPSGYQRMMAWYAEALQQITIPYQSRCIQTRSGETHILTAGSPDAPPVVLLHGININASVWIPQINGLAASHYLIAPDVPGFAGRGSSYRIPYTGSALAHWLADVLDGLNIPSAVVVGASAGGYFALKFAAHYPSRARAVLLINPCGVTRFRGVYRLTRNPVAVCVAHWFRPLVAHRSVARGVVQRGMTPNQQPTAHNIELAYLLLAVYTRRISPPLIPDAELARITAPVTLLSGEHEIYTDPSAVAARLHATLPCLTAAYTIPAAGHDINKEQPALVNEQIARLHTVRR